MSKGQFLYKMKKVFTYLFVCLLAVSLTTACGSDDDEVSEQNLTVTLSTSNLTEDGYFDGILYYKITSKSPREVTVNKADTRAVNVEVPTIVNIDGIKYTCTSIASKAFRGCSSLAYITIPSTIVECGASAFYGCEELKTVNISDLSAWCNINFDGYYSSPFSYGANLFINGKAFDGEVIMPKGITSMGNTFSGCKNLVSVVIQNGVTIIDVEAFYGCGNLTSIDIPSSVSIIRFFAFYGCHNLKSVRCMATTPPVYDTSGGGDFSNYKAVLYVPYGTKELYRSTYPWNKFDQIVEE